MEGDEMRDEDMHDEEELARFVIIGCLWNSIMKK